MIASIRQEQSALGVEDDPAWEAGVDYAQGITLDNRTDDLAQGIHPAYFVVVGVGEKQISRSIQCKT